MHRLKVEGAQTVVTQLQCGDAWIAAADGKLLIVERKTADDLLASIADGRLFDQAAAMTAMTPWSYIAVEGVLEPSPNGKTISQRNPTGWQWAAVQGALQTVQEMGVAVVYLSGPEEFAPFIERLARRDRSAVRVGAVRKPELLAPGMSLLMSLPGIGPDRAKNLLEQAGTAAFALSCMTDDHLNVIGIGKETRAKVREALGLEVGARLEIVND
jgi:ERCC4-type nuclease